MVTLLNGLTLASLYFVVASGFTLVFGLMRNVNLAHGSLYLLGGYVGYVVAEQHRLVGAGAGGRIPGRGRWLGLLLQVRDPAAHAGSGAAADDGHDRHCRSSSLTCCCGAFTGEVHQMEAPAWLRGPIRGLPIVNAYSAYRLSLLALRRRDRRGAVAVPEPYAGRHDDPCRRRRPRDAGRVGRQRGLVFAITFAIGAGLAGLGGVIGAVELSMVPGEDTRLLLASLIVVIVGGMGSVVGAAIGAVILGLAETFGLAYAPTYSVVFTFVILVVVLAFRPRGLMGRAA